MALTNQQALTMIQKADIALADLITDGGYLQPEQALKFYRIMIQEARLLPMCSVVPMKSHTKKVPKVRFGSRITRAGTSAQALPLGQRAKPDLSQIELSTKLFKAEVRLDDETLEDNVEGDAFKNTIMQLMGERIALDTDEVVANGDTASADPFLAQFDGIRKQVASNVVNAGNAFISTDILKSMVKAMPKEFLRDRKAMRYLVSTDTELDYRHGLTQRATVGGDKYIFEDVPVMYTGIPIEQIPVFPENLGGGSNQADAILMDPKNAQVGVWRQVKIETDKDISAGVMLIVATFRMDVKLAVEQAAVKATAIRVA